RELEIVDSVIAPAVGSLTAFRRLRFTTKQELGTDEHTLERDLDTFVESLTVGAALAVEGQRRLNVGTGDGPPVRAASQAEKNLRSAAGASIGGGRCTLENATATRRIARADRIIRTGYRHAIDIRLIRSKISRKTGGFALIERP